MGACVGKYLFKKTDCQLFPASDALPNVEFTSTEFDVLVQEQIGSLIRDLDPIRRKSSWGRARVVSVFTR